MISTYVVGTNTYRTRAEAIKKAREYADETGMPEPVHIERQKTDRYTKTRGRVLGFSASSILPTKTFYVKPSRRSNPSLPKDKWIPTHAIRLRRDGGIDLMGAQPKWNKGRRRR
jgi:hypothetical protein